MTRQAKCGDRDFCQKIAAWVIGGINVIAAIYLMVNVHHLQWQGVYGIIRLVVFDVSIALLLALLDVYDADKMSVFVLKNIAIAFFSSLLAFVLIIVFSNKRHAQDVRVPIMIKHAIHETHNDIEKYVIVYNEGNKTHFKEVDATTFYKLNSHFCTKPVHHYETVEIRPIGQSEIDYLECEEEK